MTARLLFALNYRQMTRLPLIAIKDARFRILGAMAPGGSSQYVFPNPISLTINPDERWAISGPRKSQLLSILAAKQVAEPTLGRVYPFLEKKRIPQQVIQTLEFRGSINMGHLSARYEFFKDEFDMTLVEELKRASRDPKTALDDIPQLLKMLELDGLGDRWFGALSNGQTRRARVAQALMKHPELLFIDDPFLGLDPGAADLVCNVCEKLPETRGTHVVLGLRAHDTFPDWITHVAYADKSGVVVSGEKKHAEELMEQAKAKHDEKIFLRGERAKTAQKQLELSKDAPSVLKMNSVDVTYSGKPVLSALTWDVKPGQKWHLRGVNGAGKSTLLSLITADHPQSWNEKIVMYGIPREVGNHSYFSINNRIGHSSPEIHALFPKRLTAQQAIDTGFIVGSVIPPKNLTPEQIGKREDLIAHFDLEEERDTAFNDLTVSQQKVVLFARAVIKNPEILILDEALSGMEDDAVDQCKEIMEAWPGSVIAVAHVDEELPGCTHFIQLKADAQPAETGPL